MIDRIAESDLIINGRGAIYHLDVRPDEIAVDIITVGDPERVEMVSKHFDSIEVKRHTREFFTHTGYIGKKRMSVISTGIGTDNIDIVLNELDALVNINFETRTVNKQLKKLNIVRIGTSGSLQRAIPLDSFLASSYGLGIDNLLNFYATENSAREKEILEAFSIQTGIDKRASKPYINACSDKLMAYFGDDFHKGVTVTCPGFYGPQDRTLRLKTSNPGLINRLSSFNYKGYQISNFEMETAGIYGLGKLLGHEVLSLNAILANRISGEFSKDPSATIKKLITKALDILSVI